MMDRAVQKELIENITPLLQIFQQIDWRDSEQTNIVMEILRDVDDKCHIGLSQVRYEQYHDILDTLKQTITDTYWEYLGSAEKDECRGLCWEIVDYVLQLLRGEKEIKKEIVFLPYKASMWDSLESVWRAFDDDKEQCNAYVVPIPYCDLNQDRTVKEWHCERELFPQYVPTLDWQSVDLEVMHPDVIFIHNPYDNYNSATSVDSNYYSLNLKKYTDLLVYVPYFVVGGRWPEVQINLSVYNHMDYMVVQRDNMQIAPMRFSEIKEGEEPYLDDFVSKEKILALGSPKIDRIYYCEKNPEVPKRWLEYIGNRKVIFYNTSISGILQQGKRFIKKMRYIFDVFSRRKDVVLLWRPHPLIESCLNSMQPDLLEDYQELKKRFINDNIGILDETPDLDMTMAISDAYLGESSSSVVSLFGYAGKPIFFAEDYTLWMEPTLEERAALQIGTHIVDNDMKHSYFLAPHYNRFCRMDWETGEITTLIDFGNTPDSKNYATFIRDEDNYKSYFAPGSAKTICIFDETTGERQDIPYDNPLESGNFCGILKGERYLYFLPYRYSAILRLDKQSGELKYLRECVEEILPMVTAEHMELMGPACWINYPNQAYVASFQTNRVMNFDLATGEYSWQAVGPEDTDCCTIVEEKYGSGIFWLFPRLTTKIRRWNTHTGECEVLDIEDYPENYQCQTDWWNGKDQYKFSGIIRVDGYIYLLPCYGSMAMRLNMAEKKIEKVDMGLPFAWEERKSYYFLQQSHLTSVGCLWSLYYQPWNDTAVRGIQFAYDNRLYWYDFHTLTYREVPCRLTEKQTKLWPTPIEQTFGRMGKDIPYATGEQRTLRSISQFVDYVASVTHDREKQREAWSELAQNCDGTCGEKVKEEILRRLG